MVPCGGIIVCSLAWKGLGPTGLVLNSSPVYAGRLKHGETAAPPREARFREGVVFNEILINHALRGGRPSCSLERSPLNESTVLASDTRPGHAVESFGCQDARQSPSFQRNVKDASPRLSTKSWRTRHLCYSISPTTVAVLPQGNWAEMAGIFESYRRGTRAVFFLA